MPWVRVFLTALLPNAWAEISFEKGIEQHKTDK